MGFIDLIDHIENRRALYFEQKDIHLLSLWINGVNCGLDISNEGSKVLKYFQEWIENKYEICGSEWGWPRILHHVAESREAAFDLFFAEYRSYLVETKNETVEVERFFSDKIPETSVTYE